MSDAKITGEMTLGNVIKEWPETAEVFFQFGLHCIGCHISAYESVADGAKAHGVNPEELVKALNEKIAGNNQTTEK
jgi:hybrid cluster-associated redox disulfide protein